MVDLVAYIGYRTGRIRGALAATTGFVAPSLLLVLGISWAYVEYGATSGVSDLVVGLDAIVVGVVASVAWDFGHQHLSGKLQIALALAALAVGVLGANLLWAVLGALIAGALFLRPPNERRPATDTVAVRILTGSAVSAIAPTPGGLGP